MPPSRVALFLGDATAAGAGGRATDLRCDIKGADGKTHADLGMTGEIIIE